MFLGKWKSHTRMAQPSEKFRWKKSMACPCFLHRVFSKAVQPSMKVVVEVYINDFFLAVEYANKWYGKSRNGVSFDRLACNRQKETLFLMPYYWDMKVWCATVSCRLDCAIKMGLRVVAIKVSRCQHGKQRKVLGSIVLKYFKAYRQGFFLPCHSRRKLVWGTRTVFLRRRLTFIQNTRKDENMQTKIDHSKQEPLPHMFEWIEMGIAKNREEYG